MSRFNKILTLFLHFLAIGLIYSVFFSRTPVETEKSLVLVAVIVAFILVYYYRPIRYTSDKQNVIIQHPSHQTKIALNTIKSIEQISYEELSIRIRLFGSGGFWGHIGVYHSTRFGKIYMNAINFDDLVLIILKSGRKIVISPEDGFRFVRQVKDSISELRED